MSGKNPFLGIGFGSPFITFARASSSSASGGSSDPKIVVSAPYDSTGQNNNLTSSGSVYVYDLDGTNEVKITPSDAAAGDRFGESAAIAHNKIVVGSPLDDDDGTSSGSVYIYNLDGTGEVKLTASDAAAGDNFGKSVAIGNNKIVVGARTRNVGALQNAGSVYVYDLDGTNEVTITASDADSSDYFGQSVAIAHNKIVVGAYIDDTGQNNNLTNSGSAYVYNLDGTGEVKLTASDADLSDLMGVSVAIGSNKIVISGHANDDAGSGSGSVYVYDLDGTNEVKITASDAAAADSFGFDVAVGNNKIVVGAYGDDDNGSLSGSVYVYDLDGTNELKITASDGAADDRFGNSVAIANNKIVVGARGVNTNTGAVYVYNLDGTGETKITASEGNSGDYFGISVTMG